MKSYYSIIKVVSNILSHDSISVGLVLSDENKMIIQFSDRKVKLANKIIDIDKNALSYFLKQITNVIDEQNELFEKHKNDLFDSPKIIDYNYFSYLNKYSNNTIQFTEPKYIKGKCDNDLFGEVFKLFIDKNYGSEMLNIYETDEKWNKTFNNVQTKLIKRVENKVHTNIKFTPQHIQNLFFNYSMDCIGLNGAFTGARTINFSYSENTIRKELNQYYAFIDILKRQFEQKDKQSSFYLISDEPEHIGSKEHKLWEKMLNLEAFITLQSEEADKIAEEIEKKDSKIFL